MHDSATIYLQNETDAWKALHICKHNDDKHVSANLVSHIWSTQAHALGFSKCDYTKIYTIIRNFNSF